MRGRYIHTGTGLSQHGSPSDHCFPDFQRACSRRGGTGYGPSLLCACARVCVCVCPRACAVCMCSRVGPRVLVSNPPLFVSDHEPADPAPDLLLSDRVTSAKFEASDAVASAKFDGTSARDVNESRSGSKSSGPKELGSGPSSWVALLPQTPFPRHDGEHVFECSFYADLAYVL